MTEDEGGLDPKALALAEHYAETLLYDFSKFLTTLAILALGGVLSISQVADPKDVDPVMVGLVLAAIAIAGVLSLTAANNLVEARAAGREPSRSLRRYPQAAMGFLGVGTGAFLMMWLDSLS